MTTLRDTFLLSVLPSTHVFAEQVQSRLETVAKERARALPGAPSCAPGHLAGADRDETRLSQWRALLRLFAPSAPLREACLIWVSAHQMTRGAESAPGRAFLATVSSRDCSNSFARSPKHLDKLQLELCRCTQKATQPELSS